MSPHEGRLGSLWNSHLKATYTIIFRALAECTVTDCDLSHLSDYIEQSLQDLFKQTSFKLGGVTVDEAQCQEGGLQDKVAFIILSSQSSDEAREELQSLAEVARSLSVWKMDRVVILDSARHGTEGEIGDRLDDEAQRSESRSQTGQTTGIQAKNT